MFADVCRAVPQPARPARRRPRDEQVHSPREYFHTYLRSLDVEREGLPETFRDPAAAGAAALRRRRPGAGPELEEAVYRVFLAQQRAADQVPVGRRPARALAGSAATARGRAARQVGEVLDRLVVATQLRYPVVGDLARTVRFRYFEEPLIQAAREEVYARASRQTCSTSARRPGRAGPRRARSTRWWRARRAARSGCSPSGSIADSRGPEPVLEVLTRRYYRMRDLEDVQAVRARRPAVRHRRLRPARRPAAPDLAGRGLRATFGALTDAWPRWPAEVADPANLVVGPLCLLAGRARRTRRDRRRRSAARSPAVRAGRDGRRVTRHRRAAPAAPTCAR